MIIPGLVFEVFFSVFPIHCGFLIGLWHGGPQLMMNLVLFSCPIFAVSYYWLYLVVRRFNREASRLFLIWIVLFRLLSVQVMRLPRCLFFSVFFLLLTCDMASLCRFFWCCRNSEERDLFEAL